MQRVTVIGATAAALGVILLTGCGGVHKPGCDRQVFHSNTDFGYHYDSPTGPLVPSEKFGQCPVGPDYRGQSTVNPGPSSAKPVSKAPAPAAPAKPNLTKKGK